MSYTIHLAKENFKFSGTHFTIFGPKQAERMHGHNYQVALNIRLGNKLDKNLGFAFDFNQVKPLIKKICDQLDEYILVPEHSPYLEISNHKSTIQIQFSNKVYTLPKSDVRLLPLVNITVEELARYFCQQLNQLWKKRPQNIQLSVTIEETRGQSVTYSE